jgi:hypothetical protein
MDASSNEDDQTKTTGGKATLYFVGTGDVQKSISEGTELAANTGVGVIFNREWDNKPIRDFGLEFSINVASTVDSIIGTYNNDRQINNSRDFGTYVLLPMNSGQATKLFTHSYLDRELFKIYKNTNEPSHDLYLTSIINGFYFEALASNRIWTDSSISKNATGMMFKFGLFHDFIPDDVRRKNGYSITIGLAYSFRGIFGDAGFNNDESNKFRQGLLGTEKTKYSGFEIDLGFRIKNIEARVMIPNLFSGDTKVPGLSETQFITSISFIGGFPIKLNE